jgi:septal ring-binding cell division protein DamX
MSNLQQKLTKIQGLLPSQRSWLERLVFQLEFNPLQLIHMVGDAGSGKTTLTLAIADLLSNEFNLALIKAEPDLSITSVRQHILEHWFGGCKDANRTLLQLVGERQLTEPLALVIDQAEQLPVELWAELAELPCLVIAATEHSDIHAELNLPLPALTMADAEMLLKDNDLSTLSVADRLDNAHGNIHVLLDPSLKRQLQSAPIDLKPASLAYPLTVFAVGMLVIAAVVVFWLWTEQQQRPAGLGELTYLPEEQEVPTILPTQPAPANKAVVEQLVGQLEQVASKTASSSASGLAKPVDFSTQENVESADNLTDSSGSKAQVETSAPSMTEQPTDVVTTSENTVQAEPPAESEVVDKPAATDQQTDTQHKVPDLSQSSLPTAVEIANSATQPIVVEREVSVAEQMAEEQKNTQPQVLVDEDLAAEAQAELSVVGSHGSRYPYSESDLLAMSDKAVALQLVVLSNDRALKDFAIHYPALETYTYQRLKNGQRQLIVVLAPFADSTEAKAQISQLPPALQQAFVKPLADIHSEISIQ